uniref:Homeobox domain-containing protein n=1 Tax=Trichuris muris TaxID=70415 RepID=A0A5S6QUL6_TRIMR
MSGHAVVYVDASDQVNRYLAAQTGLTVQQVRFLRAEFEKQGRNPMPEMLEILAVENGFEETQVKNLFNLHLAHVRRTDGIQSK